MNWQDILIILVPMMSLMGWIYSRIEKRIDCLEQKMESRFEEVQKKFDEIQKALHSLDMRLTRLEGRFDERGYWESRKTGTFDEK